uniref:NADH dehydrogenase subunit 6 n=1 Tax=Panagrolaimus sp. PS1159 TaxID=55785 RepID=A0AC35FG64_9BILA
METRSIKLLLLCLMFVSLIFYGVGFGGDDWYMGLFCFIINILLIIGFIIGIISPPQPMIYMIACFVEGFFVIISVILAIVCFVIGGINAGSNISVIRDASTWTIIAGVFLLLDAFICGAIAFFSFKVWKLGG